MPYTKNYDLDTDTTLGGDNASDYVAASQKATKTYIDNHSGGGGANTDLSNLTATGEAHFLKNTATGTSSLTLLGTSSTENSSINIGVNSQATGSDGVAIGVQANANSNFATAIGYGAKVTGSYGIQLGYGTNTTGHFYVGFNNAGSPINYRLLDRTTGLVPDARLNNLKFDGQWVIGYKLITEATAIGTVDVTSAINSYLPDRNYTYQILCRTNLSRNDSSGTNTKLEVYTSPADIFFSKIQADGSNFQQSHDAFMLIVRPNDTVYYKISSYKASSAASFDVLAYRRVGTNS